MNNNFYGGKTIIQLSKKQKSNINNYIDVFKKYKDSEEYQQDTKHRFERESFIQSLTKDKIKQLTELELGEIISNLWASHIWGNQDYLVNDIIIAENGMEKLRKEFLELYFGQKTHEERYERFINNIKGLGPASVTELLCLRFPGECAIWNKKARDALKKLGFEQDINLNKYQIRAKGYNKFNDIISAIAVELKKQGFKEADHFFVDYYLYEVQKQEEETKIKKEAFEFEHVEIEDMIRDIGSWLGFEAKTEKQIAHGAVVDAIWTTRIGNLGVINYVFEVQSKGSIDSLILNLQKATKNKSVQKVVAVSDEEQLDKIRKEIESLPEAFRESMTYLEVSDVMKMHNNLSEVNMIIENMNLVRSQFEIEK